MYSIIQQSWVSHEKPKGADYLDNEKLKQWMDIAGNMDGSDFWRNIFDREFAEQFIDEPKESKNPASNGPGQTAQQENKPQPFPLIDIIEGKQEVIVLIDLPGIRKKDIELRVSGDSLVIKGNASHLHSGMEMTHSERFYGSFQRQITLPDTINAKDLRAKFWNGILFVSYRRETDNNSSND